MAGNDDPPPVHAFAYGRLSAAEREELARRALQDPDLMDDLWDALRERDLMSDPAVRDRLRAGLLRQARADRWRPLLGWLTRPLPRFALAGGLAAGCIFLAWNFTQHGGSGAQATIAGVDAASSVIAERVFAIQSQARGERLIFRLNRTDYRAGELVHAEVNLQTPAAVFVAVRSPGVSAVLVYPSDGGSAVLPAGRSQIVFDASNPARPLAHEETMTLRVLALPPDEDIRVRPVGHIDYSLLDSSYHVSP